MTDDLVFTDASFAEKNGFETSVEIPVGDFSYLRIIAMDKDGRPLAMTKTIRADEGTANPSSTKCVIFLGAFLGCCFVFSLIFHKKLRLVLKVSKQRLRSQPWFQRWEKIRSSTTKFELEPLYGD